MRTGIFGGTFDPIHNAHLTVAEAVRRRLDLREVLFVPVGQPWLKSEQPAAPAADRLRMVELAVESRPDFLVSRAEIDRPGLTYTVDTLASLREHAQSGEEFYFIMGWDSLADLPRWKEPARIIRLCHLVAVPRPGFPLPDLDRLEAAIPGIRERLTIMDEPNVDISSTALRGRVAAGLPIQGLVPEAVEKYILEKKLYAGGVHARTSGDRS